MRSARVWRPMAVVLVGALAVSACGDDATGGEAVDAPDVSIGGCAETTSVTAAVAAPDPILNSAIADGLFAARCIAVTIDDTMNGADIASAVSDGTVHFGLLPAFATATAVANRDEAIQIVGIRETVSDADHDVAVILVSDPALTDVADFSGKTIGIRSPRADCTVIIKQAMANAGIADPDSAATYVEADSDADLRAKLTSGEIDATCATYPTALGFLDDGATIIGGASTAFPAGFVVGVTAASDEFVAASASVVGAWNDAMTEAAEAAIADEAAFRDRLSDLAGVTDGQAERTALPEFVGGADPAAFDFEPMWAAATEFGLFEDSEVDFTDILS